MFDTAAYKELFETQEESQHPWSMGMTEQQVSRQASWDETPGIGAEGGSLSTASSPSRTSQSSTSTVTHGCSLKRS